MEDAVHQLTFGLSPPGVLTDGSQDRRAPWWWAQAVGAFARVGADIELVVSAQRLEELMNVRGIGEKSFLKLKPLIAVQARADKPTGQ